MTAPISNGPTTTRLHHYAGHYCLIVDILRFLSVHGSVSWGNCMRNLLGLGVAVVCGYCGRAPLSTGAAAVPSGPSDVLHTGGARSLMGSALEGLRLHARKSSPCIAVRSRKREKVRPARSQHPKFGVFALAGRVFSRECHWRGGVGRIISRQPVLCPGLVGDAAHIRLVAVGVLQH